MVKRNQSVATCDQSEVESASLQKVGVKSSILRLVKNVTGKIGVIVKKNMRNQSAAKYDQSEVESTSLQKVGVKSSTARLLKDVKWKIMIPSIAEGVIDKKNMIKPCVTKKR